jgi:hypothetical protein
MLRLFISIGIVACLFIPCKGQVEAIDAGNLRRLDEIVTAYLVNAEQVKYPGYFFRMEAELLRPNDETDLFEVTGFRVKGKKKERFEYEGRREFTSDLTRDFSFGRLSLDGRSWVRTDIDRPNEVYEEKELERTKTMFDWNPFDCVLNAPVSHVAPKVFNVLPKLYFDKQIVELTTSESELQVTWQLSNVAFHRFVFSTKFGNMPIRTTGFAAVLDNASGKLKIGPTIRSNEISWEKKDDVWLPVEVASDAKHPTSSSKIEYCWISAEKINQSLYTLEDFQLGAVRDGVLADLDIELNTLDPSSLLFDRSRTPSDEDR